MKWQDAKKGENDKVNMRRERNGSNENSKRLAKAKRKSAQKAPSTSQDARWMVAA
jgi:hypothetical protein